MFVEHFHGEVTRVPMGATAVPHRSTGYNLIIPSVWADPAATAENVAWTQGAFAAMSPFGTGRRCINYLGEDDIAEHPVQAAFPPNYERLVEVKRKYDPENLFRLNLNIRPTS